MSCGSASTLLAIADRKLLRLTKDSEHSYQGLYYFSKLTLCYWIIFSREWIWAEVDLFCRIPPWMTHPATALALLLNSTTRRATPVSPTTPVLFPSLQGPLGAPPTGIPEAG